MSLATRIACTLIVAFVCTSPATAASMEEARAFYNAGEFAAAENQLSELLEASGSDPNSEVLHLHALNLLKLEKYDEFQSVRESQGTVDLLSLDQLRHLDLEAGITRLRDHDYSQAKDQFEDIRTQYPDTDEASKAKQYLAETLFRFGRNRATRPDDDETEVARVARLAEAEQAFSDFEFIAAEVLENPPQDASPMDIAMLRVWLYEKQYYQGDGDALTASLPTRPAEEAELICLALAIFIYETEGYVESIPLFGSFLETYPTSLLAPVAQEQKLRAEFRIGRQLHRESEQLATNGDVEASEQELSEAYQWLEQFRADYEAATQSDSILPEHQNTLNRYYLKSLYLAEMYTEYHDAASSLTVTYDRGSSEWGYKLLNDGIALAMKDPSDPEGALEKFNELIKSDPEFYDNSSHILTMAYYWRISVADRIDLDDTSEYVAVALDKIEDSSIKAQILERYGRHLNQ